MEFSDLIQEMAKQIVEAAKEKGCTPAEVLDSLQVEDEISDCFEDYE